MSSSIELDMESFHEGREDFLMALETIQMIKIAVFPYALTGRKAWISLQKSAFRNLITNKPVAPADEHSTIAH